VKRFLMIALLAPAAWAATPATVPDTMQQRLLACTSCHARSGASEAYFPRISGKPAGYLYHQLLNFRDGRRQAPIMNYLVTHLPENYLRDIADHFAGQHLAPPSLRPSGASRAQLEQGKALVLKGDVARGLPACVACHGTQLTGVKPAIPGLLGLPRDYINAQFGNWKNGTRKAHTPDCMAMITARMSNDDIVAVSSWLSEQPVPASYTPAENISRPLPIRCGSDQP
jgi:cytochrome c553